MITKTDIKIMAGIGTLLLSICILMLFLVRIGNPDFPNRSHTRPAEVVKEKPAAAVPTVKHIHHTFEFKVYITIDNNITTETTAFTPEVLEHIKNVEGFYPRAYHCPGGELTVGYGFTKYDIPDISLKTRMTREEADVLLTKILVENYRPRVKNLIEVPISQKQLDTFTSIAYNIGVPAFEYSSFLGHFNEGEYNKARISLLKWVRADGRVLAGLVSRRKSESKMIFGM